MLDYVMMPLKRYTDFAGRSRRKEYWFYYLAVFIVSIIAQTIDGALGMVGMVGPYGPLTFIVLVGTIIPTIAAGIRRMHDQDRSGWWIICPIVNICFPVPRRHQGAQPLWA